MPAAYKRRITQKERKEDGIERFTTPSVPFAERRIINMKKICRILILIVLLSALTGCDEGLRIIGMEIVNYPDKLIYVANKDDKLDLSGGKIELILKDKAAQSIDPMTEEEMEILHDIDFSKPGIYIVTLYRNDDAKVEFPIQVVDEIYLKNLLEE